MRLNFELSLMIKITLRVASFNKSLMHIGATGMSVEGLA
jgi:hypothetical protein